MGIKTSPSLPSRTFEVNSVVRNEERLKTASSRSIWQKLLLSPVESCYENSQSSLCKPLGFHGLIEAAHVAFARHYGLELSPDDIWLTITQGFAGMVNRDPEKYRSRFVSHQGKKQISIVRDQFCLGDPDNDWQGCFSEFSEKIRGFIGDETHALLLCDFSTTGAIERATSEMVLMDSVQSYFQYEVGTRCGIPFITILGSADDWRNLARKARALFEFGDLGWWLDPLEPVFEEFINAAEGRINQPFWNSIYKYQGPIGSGSPSITGWLVELIPYTKQWDEWKKTLQGDFDTSDLPPSLSRVPFIWDYLGQKLDYEFFAGIVGYEQNQDTLALKPRMGWAVRPALDEKDSFHRQVIYSRD